MSLIIIVQTKDDVHEVQNYRSISLLSNVAKIFEKVFEQRLEIIFVKNI